MRDGVLSGCCLHGHGPVGGDESVAPVTPSDGSVVSHLLRESGTGEVVDSLLVVVTGVDVQFEVDLLLSDDLQSVVGDEVVHLLDGGLVVGSIGDVLVDHCTSDGHGDLIVNPGAHDFNILSGLLEFLLHCTIDVLLCLECELVSYGVGCVSDTERGIIGENSRGLVDSCEVIGSHSDLRIEDYLGVNIEVGECLLKVLAGCSECCGLAGKVLDELSVVDERGGPSDQKHVNGIDDVSAAEFGCCGTCGELCLVGVVMEDVSDLLDVHLTKSLGNFLSESVCDRVGVSYSLPLDDLDFFHRGGDLVETLDINVLSFFRHVNSHYFTIYISYV